MATSKMPNSSVLMTIFEIFDFPVFTEVGALWMPEYDQI